MSQPISPALAKIRDPNLPASSLIAALKTLKNDVVGHEQRKELMIRQGIVPYLTDILVKRRNGAEKATDLVVAPVEHGSALGSGLTKAREGSTLYATTKANGKRRSVDETDGSREKTHHRRKNSGLWSKDERSSNADPDLYPEPTWTEEDEVRLQITMLVGSLGHGGFTFVSPLVVGGIVTPLITACNTYTHPRLLTATLETLLVLANAIAFRQSRIDTTDSPIDATEQTIAVAFAQEIYAKACIRSLVDILAQLSSAIVIKRQILLVSQLIARTCKSNQHRNLLVRVGALDQLVARFAANALVFDGKELDHASLDLPPPVDKDGLFVLLEAITTIIQHSDYRTARFLYSPDVLSVFASSTKNDVYSEGYTQVHIDPAVRDRRSKPSFSLGASLPQVQPGHIKGDRIHHDATIANYTTSGFNDQLRAQKAQKATQKAINDSHCHGLFAWLMDVARKERRHNRLITIWALTLVTGVMEKISLTTWTEYTFKNLDRSLALLIVPLLMNMIDESNAANSEQRQANSSVAWASSSDGAASARMTDLNRTIKECAPTVLAVLIEGSPTLQKAAVEAGAIKKLCQALKKTFDPSPSERKSLWTPTPTNAADATSGHVSPENNATSVNAAVKLGLSGLSPEELYALKCRRSTLQALAAIANKEDAYRKAIIENGVISCIIDSLIPFADETPEAGERPANADGSVLPQQQNRNQGTMNGVFLSNKGSSNAKGRNPVPVLVGACHTARAMSRSVSILRTSLIDAGVARPIHDLVKHPDEEVQIAATDVMCNLLLEVSPMREELIEAGAMETLCTHAHKNNAKIREISLWALKHLVLAAPNQIRINCLSRLGPQWLMQIISEESESNPTSQLDSVHYNGHNQPQLGMGTPNAAGEQVDLLNAVEDPNDMDNNFLMHSDDDLEEGCSDIEDESEEPASFSENLHDSEHDRKTGNTRSMVSKLDRNWSSMLRQLTSHQRMLLRAIKLPEKQSNVLRRRDNLRVQEQGLDFIRNLITSKGAFEMIDHVIAALDSQQFFEVLCHKLMPIPSEQLISPFCGAINDNTASATSGMYKSPFKKMSRVSSNDGLTFHGHYHQRHRQLTRTANHAANDPRLVLPANESGVTAEKSVQPSESQLHSHQAQDHFIANNQGQSQSEGPFQQHRQQMLSPSFHQRQQQQEGKQQPFLHGYQFPELLLTTIFILVHIAAGTPRHRSMLIGEQALLRSVLPFFSHPDRRLRAACVWLVSNLTWVDNASDAPAARIRALELRALGFEERLRVAAGDSDLDVRERAKTALDQCGKLLGGPPLSAPGIETGSSNNNNTNNTIGTNVGMAVAPSLPMNIPSISNPTGLTGGAPIGPVFGSSVTGTPLTNPAGAPGASSGNSSVAGTRGPSFGRQI